MATDTDLDIVGEYSESWVIVTKERVLVFYVDEEDGEALLQKDIAIAEIETARTDTRVGSGFLEVKTNDVFEELARFSNKNADKFARVAQRIKSLAQGKQVDAEPETEAAAGRCEKCGCLLPDKHMKVCPKLRETGNGVHAIPQAHQRVTGLMP